MRDQVASTLDATPAGRPSSFTVVTDNLMTRLAYLAIATEADIILIGRCADVGWSTTAGLIMLLGSALVTAEAIWIVSRLPKKSLVISLDVSGIRLGPSRGHELIPLMRRGEDSGHIPWANVRRFELILRKATMTDSGLTMRQRQVRLSTGDGRCFERALPASANLAMLERVAGAYPSVIPIPS